MLPIDIRILLTRAATALQNPMLAGTTWDIWPLG
jgi:hypothetical protein